MNYHRLLAAALLCAVSTSAAPEGTALSVAATASEIILPSGVTLQISPRSMGTLFSDHVVLDAGALRVGHFDGFAVNVQQLEIQAQSAAAQAVVRLDGETVEVASLGGSVDVLNGGAMLARIAGGSRMSFRQSGASPGRTGAASPRKHRTSDRHIMLWLIGGTAAAALTIGLIAAAQGKSPF